METFSGYHLACVDATGIAIKNALGTRTHPIINTAMIGAFARMLEMPSLEAISDAIKADISLKPERNIQASKEAYENVQLFGLIE
jgi:pyruvate ferredoxin oxidoreductase gamma subunit/2-oxoisovalerate ferredoxin oxidoreductase gamma subunit